VSGCTIKAIASRLPDQVLTNEQLAGGTWAPEQIASKTGIVTRHVAAEGECASDLAVAAAERLLSATPGLREQVDFVMLCTQTPDHFLPTTACLLQNRLGLSTSCGALDLNLGCSGYVYGLAVVQGLIAAGTATNVLLLTADTYTRLIHPGDRATRVLFGDGACATWVAATEGNWIGPFALGTDGSGAEHFIVQAGAFRTPASAATKIEETDASGNTTTPAHIRMGGPAIFAFSLERVPAVVHKCLGQAGLELDDIDYYVFHQANRFMLEHLRRKVGIPQARMVVRMEATGNTVSASIPLALEALIRERALFPGARLMLVGFGVGLSWGACVVTWEGKADS
jgi:3-oxoacyl-[acyl-carrier-protein] synthase-3